MFRTVDYTKYAVVTGLLLLACLPVIAAQISAGVAKVDITERDAGPVNDLLYAKALVLRSGSTSLVIVTVDAVAIGEIGRIGNDYLPTVRSQIQEALGIPPSNVLINASHCHGVVVPDVAARTVQAVREAARDMVPVRVAVGSGREDRVSENRRIVLKSGKVADSRHAYSMPPDEEVAGVGPIDPEIGVLRLEKEDGRTLAVVYNFACHPIQGVPGGGNTADLTGFASRVIEDNLDRGAIALFLQGCAGDINPVLYKDVNNPRDAEPLGNRLGLSALNAVRNARPSVDARLGVLNETISLPRANTAQRIAEMEAEQKALLESLQGTSLNFKTFVPLLVKYSLSEQHPSYYANRYLHEEAMGRDDLKKLDAENRRNMEQYIQNIHTMEKLTRLQTNLALLRKHYANNAAADTGTIDAEIMGVRIGDFALVTFPGELMVQIGLNIKQKSPHPHTYVAGYTNGYIYYAPTTAQLANVGCAQEDSDCVLAPGWQEIYEAKAADLLSRL